MSPRRRRRRRPRPVPGSPQRSWLSLAARSAVPRSCRGNAHAVRSEICAARSRAQRSTQRRLQSHVRYSVAKSLQGAVSRGARGAGHPPALRPSAGPTRALKSRGSNSHDFQGGELVKNTGREAGEDVSRHVPAGQERKVAWRGPGRCPLSQHLPCCVCTPLHSQGTGLARMSAGSHSQSEEVGEPLEDAGTQAADAVVGEIPAR